QRATAAARGPRARSEPSARCCVLTKSGGAELFHDPARAGEQAVVVVAARDHLQSDRQAIRPTMSRQRHRWPLEPGPELLERGIAGRIEAAWRLALHAGRDHAVEAFVRWLDPGAAVFGEPQRSDIVVVPHRHAELDAIAQHLADALAIRSPVGGHRL